MNASAGLAWDSRPLQETDELQLWMQLLGSGEWSADDFLREVLRLEKHDAGLPWDVLTLLEQHFQRDLITHDQFICVRARLQKHLLDDVPAHPVPAQPAGEAEEPPVTPQAGDMIRGRYRIAEVLERNARGAMLEAVDEHRADVPDVRKRVCICLFDLGRDQEARLLQRVYRLQSLSHPCIQKVFDVDEQQGQAFVVLEWLGGLHVHQLQDLNGGLGMSPHVAQTILRAIASALSYAHARDVCHGAVDMRSVIVTESGDIKLRGFERSAFHSEGGTAADRQAFARLAYRLLAGSALPEFAHGARARKAALRQPRGLPRNQWELLRAALLGRDPPALLAAFAGEGDIAAGRYALNQAVPAAPQRRRAPVWLAATAVVAVGAMAGFLFVEPSGQGSTLASVPAPPITPTRPRVAAAPDPLPAAKPPAAAPRAAAVLLAPRRPPPAPQRARIELAASTVETPAEEPFARVQVRRRDNSAGPVSFKWWTETGSAKANRDFLGIEPRLEWIPDGSMGVDLRVPLLVSPARSEPRTFYVKIELTGSGDAVLGDRTLTQVSIQPPASQQAGAKSDSPTFAALP